MTNILVESAPSTSEGIPVSYAPERRAKLAEDLAKLKQNEKTATKSDRDDISEQLRDYIDEETKPTVDIEAARQEVRDAEARAQRTPVDAAKDILAS